MIFSFLIVSFEHESFNICIKDEAHSYYYTLLSFLFCNRKYYLFYLDMIQ